MMIFINDPVPVANPAERAIRMAVAMRERVRELTVKWHKLGYELDFGVGIAQGYATIGGIGFEGRLDYGSGRADSKGSFCAYSVLGRPFIRPPGMSADWSKFCARPL
jgi:hypothetical protein